MYVHYYPLSIAALEPHYSQQMKQLARPNNSPYPPVNPQKFLTSAQKIQAVMQQAHLLLDKITSSEQFAHDLMDAAQHANNEKVNQMIKSVGITNTFDVKYTPDGIRVVLIEKNCCSLTILLNW